MIKLKGKTAIITGGAMGIGLATCKRLLKEGCTVTIWDLNESELEKVQRELNRDGNSLFAHVCDVSDLEQVKELSQQARNEMGRVDILINNAGFVRHGMFWEQPLENAIKQMDVNVNALFYSIHEFLPEMLARNSGHIVNVSSGVAFSSAPGLAAYTSSKWAVWGLTDVLRLEAMVAGKNRVLFTSVHSGNIQTGMFEGFSLNLIGKWMSPPIKSHDVIAKGIVEDGLKRGRHLVVRPKRIYMTVITRGLLPNWIIAKMSLLIGMGDCVKHYKGRTGFVHSDSRTDQGKRV